MEKQSFYTRQMLMQYGHQLVSARRLARYEQLVGKEPPNEDTALLRRKAMVERISKEIMENLIFSGSQNPIVQEVHKNLEDAIGQELIFQYPPADTSFKIFKKLKDGQQEEVSPKEKSSIMHTLWEVTLKTVEASTL